MSQSRRIRSTGISGIGIRSAVKNLADFVGGPPLRRQVGVLEAEKHLASTARALGLLPDPGMATVGYSFPRADTHMRYFLAASLLENLRWEHIDVVGPQARLERVFSCPSRDRQGAVFCGKVRPLPYGRGSEKDFLNTLSDASDHRTCTGG